MYFILLQQKKLQKGAAVVLENYNRKSKEY